MRKNFFVAALVVSALATGCSLNVGPSSPRPNIDMDELDLGLALELSNDIEDRYRVPSQHGVPSFGVNGWRDTLSTGFKNGFSRSFKLVGKDGQDLTVQINEAMIELIPTGLGPTGGVAAVRGQVRYRARLIDKTGKVVRRSARTVSSKGSNTSPSEVTRLAQSAVESMYEAIAEDFFGDR